MGTGNGLDDQTGRLSLSLHERVTGYRQCGERVGMMSAARRSIASLKCDRACSRAVLVRSRESGSDAGDVVCHLRGDGKAKRERAAH